MKFKVGDKVRIIDRKHGHKFNIGDIVIIDIVNYADDDYLANNNSTTWWVQDNELELVDS